MDVETEFIVGWDIGLEVENEFGTVVGDFLGSEKHSVGERVGLTASAQCECSVF